MKILPFPPPPPPGPDVASRLDLVERLLRDCGERQSHLREEGRAMRLLLERLEALRRQLIARTQVLQSSAGRLGVAARRVGPSPPTA